MVISVYSICFATTLTTLFEWTVIEKNKKADSAANASIFEIASSELGEMEMYQTIYNNWFTGITFVIHIQVMNNHLNRPHKYFQLIFL